MAAIFVETFSTRLLNYTIGTSLERIGTSLSLIEYFSEGEAAEASAADCTHSVQQSAEVYGP